jgi:1-acyl-sn-glycerol-3-phosphate acyltransferase
VVRLPKRPNVHVHFFPPAEGGPRPGESAGELMQRLLAQIRDGAPYATPGRSRSAAKYAERARNRSA